MLGRRRRYLLSMANYPRLHHANYGGITDDGSPTKGVMITVTFVVGDDV